MHRHRALGLARSFASVSGGGAGKSPGSPQVAPSLAASLLDAAGGVFDTSLITPALTTLDLSGREADAQDTVQEVCYK